MYLFLPNLCLRLSEVQPGESSSVKSRCRWIFQIITPHPLYSSDSVSWEEMFQPDLFSFGKPFQILNPMAMFGRGHVLGVMPWLLWHGPAQVPSLLPFCFVLLSCEKADMCMCISLGVQACEQMIHLVHREGRCGKIWKRLLLYKNSILIS